LAAEFEKELDIAKATAKAVGNMQKISILKQKQIIRKSEKELVTHVDMDAQKTLEDTFIRKFPNYKIFSEERLIEQNYPKEDFFWIIDPLDGTHNYISQLPFYGISIALANNDEFYLGVIYIPEFDLLFWGTKGCGAFCNGERISVSENNNLSRSMITYDNQFYKSENSINNYKKLIGRTFTTRILGSAACDICYVASGKIDARIWNNTKLCDIAAGVTIINEAGGKITDFDNQPISVTTHDVIASNGLVHDEIINILN